MIGRHQMRGWRKLKSGLMRITGSAHIYYPIREIDSCRRSRRTRHSNFGGGSWSLLVICPPSSSMIECSKLGFCWRSRIAFKIVLVLIVFFCFLIEIGSVIKNKWYGSPFAIHSFGVLHIGSGITSWRRRGLRRRRQGGVIICGSDFSTGDINR